MNDTVTQQELHTAVRQAVSATQSAAQPSGPQASGHITAGEVIDGVFTPYGRVGITEPKNGFLPRRTGG